MQTTRNNQKLTPTTTLNLHFGDSHEFGNMVVSTTVTSAGSLQQTQTYAPPESSLASEADFPLTLSKNELGFGLESEQYKLNELLTDSFSLTNKTEQSVQV
jgi:hypothetical protein